MEYNQIKEIISSNKNIPEKVNEIGTVINNFFDRQPKAPITIIDFNSSINAVNKIYKQEDEIFDKTDN